MTAWWYWLAFVIVAAVVFAGPWLCSVLEDRADARDLDVWMQLPGATR